MARSPGRQTRIAADQMADSLGRHTCSPTVRHPLEDPHENVRSRGKPRHDRRRDRTCRAERGGPSGRRIREAGVGREIETLRCAVEAGRTLKRPVPHILLYGPSGLGKTSLAHAVANEVGAGFHSACGGVLKDPGALLGLLTTLRAGDVLFLDEIHRLPVRVAESLYEAMEDGRISLPVRCGVHRRVLHVRLASFTLIGATTQEDLLPDPLRNRFVLRERLTFYDRAELTEVLVRAGASAGLVFDDPAAILLAEASRDTPREGLALFRSVRDEAEMAGRSTIDVQTVRTVLDRLGIDSLGLRPSDREYLSALGEAGCAVSLSTLAATLGVPRRTVRRSMEPYLIRRGLIAITRRGRVLRC